MTYLYLIALSILTGLFMTRLMNIFKFPAVTAYLITGIIIGPYVLGAFGVPYLGFNTPESVESLSILSNTALGFIAFSIGNEFRLSALKETGKQATVIGILQAVITTVIVDIVLVAFHFIFPDKLSLSAAIVLGAIAAATAPAATLMVVKQYKAKGKLTDLLLPIVALDDAVGLVIFSVSFGVAKALESGVVDVIAVVVDPLIEIVASLILGTIMGALMTLSEKWFHSRSKRLSISVAFVFLTIALSMLEIKIGPVTLSFSLLLTCMMLGTIFCNLCNTSLELMDRVDRFTAPLNVVFFVLSGAELNLMVFKDYMIVIIGVVYIIFRSLGKYVGAFSSAKLMKCEEKTTKYLGVTLLPQAGVALGMSLLAFQELGEVGIIIRNITLFAVLVYEIVGPMLTKIALKKAGEITEEEKTSARIKNEDHPKFFDLIKKK